MTDVANTTIQVALTDRAARRIAQIASSEARATRCSGSASRAAAAPASSTSSTWSATPSRDDSSSSATARVLVDSVSLDYLKGSEVDFVDDLMGASFRDPKPQRTKLVRLRHELHDLNAVA